VRLSVVMTHPIQYYSPWFRYITERAAGIHLTVHYCIIPTAKQQGVGFDQAFEWDASVLAGYEHVVLRKPSEGRSIHSSSFFGVTVPEIVTSVRQADPDVVLVPGWYSASLVMAAISARFRGLPVIYRGDTQMLGTTGSFSIARYSRTRVMLHLFTHYLTVGQRNHDYLLRHRVPESRIFLSPHCVDNDFFAQSADSVDRQVERKELGISRDAFVVLFAGKLEEKKRPWEVIEAAGMLPGPVAVVIAGAGEMEARCRETAARSSTQVIFAGFRSQREIARLYAVADCLALPSDAGETWGLVVNEALAAGIPCIVSDRVGCGPDLIESGETGFVVPWSDTRAIAKSLSIIQKQIAKGHSYVASCRKRADAYSFETATAGLRAAIMNAVSG
jgi:glycosyltransferase involved in cell wall biosynthesis